MHIPPLVTVCSRVVRCMLSCHNESGVSTSPPTIALFFGDCIEEIHVVTDQGTRPYNYTYDCLMFVSAELGVTKGVPKYAQALLINAVRTACVPRRRECGSAGEHCKKGSCTAINEIQPGLDV